MNKPRNSSVNPKLALFVIAWVLVILGLLLPHVPPFMEGYHEERVITTNTGDSITVWKKDE